MTDTAYLPVCVDDENEVDCVVEYEVIGFYRLHLISCKVAGNDRPDILPLIDEDEQERIEQAICRRLEWKKEPKYRGDN